MATFEAQVLEIAEGWGGVAEATRRRLAACRRKKRNFEPPSGGDLSYLLRFLNLWNLRAPLEFHLPNGIVTYHNWPTG
jgi:hypothetical protein